MTPTSRGQRGERASSRGDDRASGRAAAALAAAACLLLVAASVAALPSAPWRALGALLAHGAHLLAAFAAGRALLRLARAAPRGALDTLVTSTSAGLAFLAFGTLALSTFGLLRPWTPWAVDAVALLAGARGLRVTAERVMEPWRMSELAVLVSSRLPLILALCVTALVHAAVPFLPLVGETGAEALALPAQAVVRMDLPAALAGLPGSAATPSAGLLLHGLAGAGLPGARLFPLTLVLLLGAAVWLHAERHVGARAADWAALAVGSAPVLLVLGGRSPSDAFLLLFGFLAFHEVADWCQHATGGKIAVASGYGGLLLAEGAAGATLFVSMLVLLFLVQALIDRHGVFRQVPGLLGMCAVALLVALPFVGLASAADRDDPLGSLAERWSPRDIGEGWDAAAADLPEEPGVAALQIATHLSALALALGPLLLGLLLLVALVEDPPDPVRHAVLAVFLALLAGLAPPPYRTFLGGLGPAAIAAGAAAVAMAARGGLAARATALFTTLALPTSLALGLATGPDLGAGLSAALRREPSSASPPDAPLVAAARSLALDPGRRAAALGTLSLAHYSIPVDVPRDAEALAALAASPTLAVILADTRTAPDWAKLVLEGPQLREPLEGGRYLLLAPGAAKLGVPARPTPPPTPTEAKRERPAPTAPVVEPTKPPTAETEPPAKPKPSPTKAPRKRPTPRERRP